jgi:hypothetical protein
MGNRILRLKHGKYAYYAVRCPEKFKSMADKRGMVMEHRLLMAEYIGRSLYKTELVTHRDRNANNNAFANLKLVRKKIK